VARGLRVAAEVERTARHMMASRELAATLAELRDLGSDVRYHITDVRDTAMVHRLLKEIHGRTGRIDGVIYAAGVTEDRLLADKDPESFARVFETKAGGAAAMFAALDELAARPRFVVLFGSIVAVHGNRGQADYAAANETLQALGSRWRERSGNRCLTVHWGPWAPVGGHGGMVSRELSREYARRDIELIDPPAGARSLWRELAWGDPATEQVVYTATAW
jgi:NAD(P)-dependent dehydrogenase (short-subunit alcohol dehydrogenase family)